MISSASAVRRLIARLCLHSAMEAPTHIGEVTLHPHQQAALDRLRPMLDELGGAMLADDVGLGKTYVALALAATAGRPLVIAPASLRPMWRDAARRTATAPAFISYERLSRDTLPAGDFTLVILDEAHHARTPGTRRYDAIARLCSNARVLLLSATPIHNTRRDLLALFALFLGARALDLDDEAAARLIVRREHGDIATAAPLPELGEPEWLMAGDDEPLLEHILALPPPLPPREAGDGGALLAVSLVRQWASSRTALAGTLRRRLARATALSAALESGCYPSRSELASWAGDDDAVQLAFAELLAPADGRSATLLRAVQAHATALRALLRRASGAADIDAARVGCLAELRERHAGERIVAFSHSADTVRLYFRGLCGQPRVGALTASGGMVASGAISRRATVERFAPAGSHVHPPRAIERIDLLITTDLLSEGINLQDASVVVHLDLPWTSARLAQRVGRSRRLGATHRRTAVYALAPPAPAEALLRVEQRLRAKAAIADATLGQTESLPPEVTPDEPRQLPLPHSSAVQWRERLARALRLWLNDDADRGPVGATPGERPDERQVPRQESSWKDAASIVAAEASASLVPGATRVRLVAAVRAPMPGVLALVHDGEQHVLIAQAPGERPTDDVRRVVEAIELVERAASEEVLVDEAFLADALAAAEVWMAERSGRHASGVTSHLAATVRRQAVRRIAQITAGSSRDRRPALAALATAARRAVAAPFGIGAEHVLQDLVAAQGEPESWLRAVIAFGEAHRDTEVHASEPEAGHIVALLLLQPEHAAVLAEA